MDELRGVEPVRFESDLGLSLTALLFRAEGAQITLLHVHGACGYYWSAGFLPALVRQCRGADVNLLTINTSGQHCITEAYRNGEYTYIGGAISVFEECVSDISGAVKFASTFSDFLVLQGHSLGCDRVVTFALESGSTFPVILVSPCDSYKLQSMFRAPETVESQIARLRDAAPTHQFELLPASEYGITNRRERYLIPVSRRTFLSIAEGPPFRLFRQEAPKPFFLDVDCLSCIGTEDDLQTAKPEDVEQLLRRRFRSYDQIVVDGADHEFSGKEHVVAEEIVTWTRLHTIGSL